MRKLLNNACFRLVLIDEDGNMSRVIPANDPGEKINVKKKGYRCISHLWGVDMRHPWKDHSVAGVEHDVEIRDSNKKKCLELFMKHKGYWWMDIFCINQVGNHEIRPVDTGALHIMGDIYKNCKECYCILDGSNNISERDLKDASFTYRIKSSQDIFLQALKKYHMEHKIHPFLFYVVGSDWVKRVWTLQECVLPENIYFIAEYDESPIVSLGDVIRLCEHLENMYSEDYEAHISGLTVGDIPEYTQKFHDKYTNGIYVLRKISKIAREYTNFKSVRKLYRENTKESMLEILEKLSRSYRLSTKEVDYVYGVAGLLRITVKGDTMDKIYDSMIMSLWSKNIFMSKEYYLRQISDFEDQDEGLSRTFARKIHGGVLVISNKSKLKTKSILDYNFGTIMRSINIGKGFADLPEKPDCDVEKCEPSWGFPGNLCTKCRKLYKENFGVMVAISGERMKMDTMEVSYLLTEDVHERRIWYQHNCVNAFRSKNVYITEKYIIALPTDYKFQVGDDITIPLHGEFQILYKKEKTNTGYEIATIVDIDKHGNKIGVGCVYNRKNK